MYTVSISNFNIRQIADSGQCFRWYMDSSNECDIYAFARKLHVSQQGEKISFNCTEDEFNKWWFDYFDLQTDYKQIISGIDANDIYLARAAEFGSGIRILKQDTWEAMLSFIISQNNNIPRIQKSIERLCRIQSLGGTSPEDHNHWPIPEAKQLYTEDETADMQMLSSLGLGYRDIYIREAAKYILESEDRIKSLKKMNYEEAYRELLSIKGVGPKVANCICLYGLHMVDSCPIDTWIKKIIECRYNGIKPRWMTAQNAGIYQQYVFYYERYGGMK